MKIKLTYSQKLMRKRFQEFLNDVYTDCLNKKVNSLTLYAKVHGVSSNAGTILKTLKIVRRDGSNYVWLKREPDSAMVTRVIEAGRTYIQNQIATSIPMTSKASNVAASTPNSVRLNSGLLEDFKFLESFPLSDANKMKLLAWKNSK